MANRLVRILYHYPCTDGAFSAFAAFMRFGGSNNIDLKFVPHSTFQSLPLEGNPLFSSDSECYLIDYIGPQKFITTLASKVKKVTLIDHHKTAIEDIENLKKENNIPSNLEVFLALEKSGATLAYEYFNREKTLIEDETKRKRLEQMFAYVEDNDLWRRALPKSKEFGVGIYSREIEYDVNKNPEVFKILESLEVEEMIQSGAEEIIKMDKIIESELTKTFKVYLGGESNKDKFGECLAVVSDYGKYRSELGNKLAIKSKESGLRAIGCLCYAENGLDPDKYKVSLRSIGTEDTTIISAAFGGGGHLNASGFTISKADFQNWIAK